MSFTKITFFISHWALWQTYVLKRQQSWISRKHKQDMKKLNINIL